MKKLILVLPIALLLQSCSVNQVKLLLTAAQAAIAASEQAGILSNPKIASYFDIGSECITSISAELSSTDTPAQQGLKDTSSCLPFVSAKLPPADAKIVSLAGILLQSVTSILATMPSAKPALLTPATQVKIKVISSGDRVKLMDMKVKLDGAHSKLHASAHSGK